MIDGNAHNKTSQATQQVFDNGTANNASDNIASMLDNMHYTISQLLDKNTQLRREHDEDIKYKTLLQNKIQELQNDLSAKNRKIIELQTTLLLAAKSGCKPTRESILYDMSRTTLSYAKRRDEENAALKEEIASLNDQKSKLEAELADIKKRDAANDSGSTPTSHRTVTQKQIKEAKKKKEEEEKESTEQVKIGPPPGHKGSARNFEPNENIDLTLDKCCKCGRTDIIEIKDQAYSKMMVEIEQNDEKDRSRLTVTESLYRVHQYSCAKCGVISSKPSSMIDGTIIGKNLLAKIVRLSQSNKSQSELRETIEIVYGKTFSRATIANALNKAARLMQPATEEIDEGIKNGEHANMDETRIIVIRPTWWLWVIIVDGKWVKYYITDTRAKKVIETAFAFAYLKMTCDAYAVYNYFKIRQLCWAHVKTKVENAITKNDTPESRYLYGRLMDIFHHAKTLPPDTPQKTIDDLIQQTKDIGQKLLDLGIKAGTYVKNCAPNLFTAVNNPGMSFTNNIAESALRPAVIKRKVSYRFASEHGARRHCTIASCLETWKRQGRDIDEELQKLFEPG